MVSFCLGKSLVVLLLIFTMTFANIVTVINPSLNQKEPKNETARAIHAFIIVDVQNCFITGNLSLSNSPARQNGAEVVPIINHLIQTILFDLIVFTHDWHPKNHISFFENLDSRRQYLKGDRNKTIHLFDTVIYTGPKNEIEQKLWPAHCIQKTNDSALHKDLITNTSTNNVFHIQKGMDPDIDSYSAFWDNKKHQKTELHNLLQKHNVTHIYVAGLATDYCVAATAIDSIDLNYTTYLIQDACRGVDIETIHNRTEEMRQRGISLIHSSQVKTLVNTATCNQICSSVFIILLFFLSSIN